LPGAVVNDLIRVVTLYAAVMASGSLAYLMGCGVASCDCYQVCYLKHRMVLTEATGDAELVLRDGREFGHFFFGFQFNFRLELGVSNSL